MKQFALYNYQFEPIYEPDQELKIQFPQWQYVNPDESFEKRQEIFGQLFPTDAKRQLPFMFEKGNKNYVHKLIIPPTEDGIIVLNLSNKRQGHRTNENQEREPYDDYPYVTVIIDNRPNVQRILIEQNAAVFKETKTPASVLQRTFEKQLKRHLLTIKLYAQYPEKEFWQEVEKHPEGFRKVIFHLPHLNLERLAKVADKYFTLARKDWDSELDLAFIAPKGGVLQLNENNLRQKALTDCMSKTGMPTDGNQRSIEMITAGESKKHIWVGRDSYLTIPISEGIIKSLTDGQLSAFADQTPIGRLTTKLDAINNELMALPYFSEQKLDELQHLYIEDKLFRTFSPALCELQESYGDLHPVIIWREVEELRGRLKRSDYPATEVAYLVSYLRRHLAQQTLENNFIEKRTDDQIARSMLCILLVLFFQLSDATPSDEDLTANPNNEVCAALAHILTNPKHSWYIDPIKEYLTHRKTDYLGNPIVLPVVNYMDAKTSLEAMDEIAKKRYNRILEHINMLSLGLTNYLHISLEKYRKIWEDICMEHNLFELMSKKEPRTYSEDFNIKMFCNVLGILQHTKLPSDETVLSDNIVEVNAAISTTNYRTYITYYKNFDDSACVYNKKQYQLITNIIENILNTPEQE